MDFVGRHFIDVIITVRIIPHLCFSQRKLKSPPFFWWPQGLSWLASRYTIQDPEDPLAFLNHEEAGTILPLQEQAASVLVSLSTRSSGEDKQSSASPKRCLDDIYSFLTLKAHQTVGHCNFDRASTSSYTDVVRREDVHMGSLFHNGNEWNDDHQFFFVFALLRERTIETLTKQSKTQFAAKLYNLLDMNFRGQETVLAVKQRQHVMNEFHTRDSLRTRLVHWRQRSRKRVELTSSLGVGRRHLKEQFRRSNSETETRAYVANTRSEKPSKRLLRMLIAEQRQKNQEIEDELRLIKTKLQQEIKARR